MNKRTKLLFSLLTPIAVLGTAGCSHNQQSGFQTSLLPAAPLPLRASSGMPDPPEVAPGLYKQEVPSVLPPPRITVRWTHADALAQRAENAFQRGKQHYQVQEIESARREFDAAIDLLLEASEEDPADRPDLERRLDSMVEAIHRFDLAGMGASAVVEGAQFEKAPLEDILQMTFPVDPKLKDKVLDQVASTVSQLPLSVNDAVLGYIHHFSGRGHKTIVAGMERSGRYRPMVQRILDEEGVPQELIHLAQAESGFLPRAVSRKAASGMWQFMAWRGQEYGLKRTPLTDDRMDPEKATRAAAHHLHDLYRQFGDWPLAIAAYNCGPGTVEKAVERTGYADFWDLRNRGVLPIETTNYVPIILAMTIMEKNAAEYGLDHIQMDPPLEYDTVEISTVTSLALVSDLTDTPVSELAAFNPAVLKGVVPAGYPLHVPKGFGDSLMAALQLVPAEHRNAWRMHRVSAGETVATIGKRYGATPASILNANSLRAGQVAVGDRLLIPAVLRAAVAVRRAPVRTVVHRRTASRPAAVHKTAANSSAPPKSAPASRGAVTRTASR